MYISKKHLNRRTVLQGAGAAVALPLLDAMVPASTALAATAAAPKPRMAFVYFPHGSVMDKFTPGKVGADFDLPFILDPLKDFQEYMTVVSGLENKPAIAAPVHAITPGTWLSCVPPRISHEPYGGVTIDQVAAQHIGQDTAMPSLEVATEAHGGEGACDRNYGCSYGRTISFSTPSTPLPMEYNPRKLFQTMFGQGDTAQERKALARENASLLDMISGDASELKKSLGPRDQAMLGDYLDSVREIERRVQKLEHRDLGDLKLPDAPSGVPENFDEHMTLMFDMIHLAYQANLTRVASFMMAAEVSNQTYNHIGISDAFHPLSHHQNNPAKMERLSRIQNYHSKKFAEFLQKMKDTPDGDAGNMLDNSILVYGSNMSDSNLHNNFPLPMTVFGKGAGTIKGNQHLKVPDRTPIANLHLTLLHRIGYDVEKFGDSDGIFTEV